jgi:nucleotide-binding universal stress UspA family protein
MPAFAQVSRLFLKNILFPTDFSDASQTALPYAQSLAKLYGSTVLVAHSIAAEPHQPIVMDRLPAQDNLAWQDARQKLDDFTKDSAFRAIPTKTLLDRGDVGEVIAEMIPGHDVDLVVLGTHGRRGVTKLILGSAAEKIYRSASCPVMTIGPKAHGSRNWKLGRILCPVDLSEDPQPVVSYALSFAEENQSEFILLHAIPLVPWQHHEEIREKSRRALEELIPEQSRDGCMPQCVVRWEHPAEAILREAQEREADLIVMSVRKSRMSTLSAHLPWPVASEVVGQAPCPVLTIRV